MTPHRTRSRGTRGGPPGDRFRLTLGCVYRFERSQALGIGTFPSGLCDSLRMPKTIKGYVMQSWSTRRNRDDDDSLRLEVERLQQENMRLRLEAQRPLSMGKLADEFAQLARSLHESADPDPSDTVDSAYHVLSNAEATRQAVLNVLDSLTIASGQLRRQLEMDVPPTEVDRRVHDRRARAQLVSQEECRRVGLPRQHSGTVTTVAHHDSSSSNDFGFPSADAAVPVDISQSIGASTAREHAVGTVSEGTRSSTSS